MGCQQIGYDATQAKESLISTLLSKSFPKVDYVFVTGDIANRAVFPEPKADSWIVRFIDALHFNKTKIYWAIGNHDIDLSRSTRNDTIKKIHKAKSSTNEFDVAMSNRETRNILAGTGVEDYYTQYFSIFGREFSLEDRQKIHQLFKQWRVRVCCVHR